MTINPICNKCGQELADFGAILLSPPDKDDKIEKFHVCKGCYKEIINAFSIM